MCDRAAREGISLNEGKTFVWEGTEKKTILEKVK